MKKIGILTFHRSFNCGSMMQAYALQTVIKKLGYESEIIDFSNDGQKKLYKAYFKMESLKSLIKNIVILPHLKKIQHNNECYERFITNNMTLSLESYNKISDLKDDAYDSVVAGSDQIWNITIVDGDDAYFLPWVKKAKRIAYAPSFGARNIEVYAEDSSKYAKYLSEFKAISIRETNGKKWIKNLINLDVPVVLDPTLLLCADEYIPLTINTIKLPKKYIFYYSPNYDKKINDLVKKISRKYDIPVIAFNSKSFYVKAMNIYGFSLPRYEDPAMYLTLIKKAELVITTSFHGTIFSSIFRKKFWTIKNGGMFMEDDRVLTMANMLDLEDRIIPMSFESQFDYLKEKNYANYEKKLKNYQDVSLEFLRNSLEQKVRK